MRKKPENRDKSDGLSAIDAEWMRLRHLIPEIIDNNADVHRIERDILRLVDERSTCEDIVNSQETVSKDGLVLVILKLEKEGTVRCVEPAEKLRDLRLERLDAQKELDFIFDEKDKMLNKLSRKKDEINNAKIRIKGMEKTKVLTREKIAKINANVEQLYDKRREAMDAVNRLVSVKMDILRRSNDANSAIKIINEEVIYLKDEKLSAMRSIKDLEYKIEEVFQSKESVTPKISVCRGLVREAYKALREVRTRADFALKEVE